MLKSDYFLRETIIRLAKSGQPLVRDKIYWVDRNKNTVMRANLDGTSPEPWHTGTSARGLVIGEKK